MSPKRRYEQVVEFINDVPPNILMEILVRLPLKTIFASKCVCKDFLTLTSPNPHFINLHSSTATQTLMLQFGAVSIPSKFLRLIEPELDIAPGFVENFLLRPIFEMPKIRTNINHYRSYIRDDNKSVLVNSCNGLLYFVRRHATDERSLVCNPVTKEYFVIPDVDWESRLSTETKSMWLGFCVSTNQYKVLRIFSSLNGEGQLELGAQVLVVGSNSWRDIDDSPFGGDLSWDSCFTTLNGDVYWLDHSWLDIVFFDFEREMFRYIALPAEFGEEELSNRRFMSIGVLRDCLCLSYNAFNAKRLDIWVMKKHGNQESWSKEFAVDTKRPSGRQLYGSLRPLQVLRSGEILLHWVGKDLVCYDPKNKSLRIVGFGWLEINPRAVAFTPSFIPLKDALSVDKVMLQYVRPRGNEVEP